MNFGARAFRTQEVPLGEEFRCYANPLNGYIKSNPVGFFIMY